MILPEPTIQKSVTALTRYWSRFRMQYPDHEVFHLTPQQLQYCLPIKLHGDEGRSHLSEPLCFSFFPACCALPPWIKSLGKKIANHALILAAGVGQGHFQVSPAATGIPRGVPKAEPASWLVNSMCYICFSYIGFNLGIMCAVSIQDGVSCGLAAQMIVAPGQFLQSIFK